MQTPHHNRWALTPSFIALACMALITAACGGSQGPSDNGTQTSSTKTTNTADGSTSAQKNTPQASAPADTQAATEIIVTAKGSAAAGIYPEMELHVDGIVVDRTTVDAKQPTAYQFTVTPAVPAGAKLDVVFVNDAMVNGEDRNLWVESVSIGGTLLHASDKGVTYDRGPIDGQDVIPGQVGLWWSGALRFTAPGSGSPTSAPPASASTPASGGASAPSTPASSVSSPGSDGGGTASPTNVAGKTPSGPITAKSGQVIENMHISTTSGPCVIVPTGVQNVTIKNNEIGPCGSDVEGLGVYIQDKTSDITVQRNVIHDVSSGVYAEGAQHPLTIDRNFVYNVHGPMPRGQMVQFNAVTGGKGRSRIACNVSDRNYGTGTKIYEDHISIFRSHGTASDPIEIASNRLRGGNSASGSGMMLGDYGGSHIWVHHNTLVWTANTGIGIAGGTNFKIEHNRIDNRGDKPETRTGLAGSAANFSPAETTCSGHTFANNRGISRSWVWGGKGEQNQGFWTDGQCGEVNAPSNNWVDETLTPAIFDEVPTECK